MSVTTHRLGNRMKLKSQQKQKKRRENRRSQWLGDKCMNKAIKLGFCGIYESVEKHVVNKSEFYKSPLFGKCDSSKKLCVIFCENYFNLKSSYFELLKNRFEI